MRLREFLEITKADLYRYAGKTSLGAFLFHYILSLGFRYTVWIRWCAVVHGNPFTRILLFPFAWLINRHQQIRFGIGISFKNPNRSRALYWSPGRDRYQRTSGYR